MTLPRPFCTAVAADKKDGAFLLRQSFLRLREYKVRSNRLLSALLASLPGKQGRQRKTKAPDMNVDMDIDMDIDIGRERR